MMEKFLMCFINGKRQVIEWKRRTQKKGRVKWRRALNQRSLATAMVGTPLYAKRPSVKDRVSASKGSCQGATRILYTIYSQTAQARRWTTCAWHENIPHREPDGTRYADQR